MLVSIVIAAHNEGDLLWKTVASCRETCARLSYEIVVADDASPDDSIEQLRRRDPDVKIVPTASRGGPSPTKDLAARNSLGEILVFLDGHCKPDARAIELLIRDVEECRGEAIVTPTVAPLDPDTWVIKLEQAGNGYFVDLEGINWAWLKLEDMTCQGKYYDTPSLIGCCFAMSRSLYDKLWGFDADMLVWGVEDVEFGVKAWLMGHPVWHDPSPVIGHRFQASFSKYRVETEHVVTNQLRMASKIFTVEVWQEWLVRFRGTVSPQVWEAAWAGFCARRGSAERERSYLMQHRIHDEFWYAERFGLSWPKRR